MWIKTNYGLFNLEHVTKIEPTDRNTVFVDGRKMADFKTKTQVQEFIEKLAEKLEAEKID